MLNRHIRTTLLAALADSPVVLLQGARQVGKTTLLRDLVEHERPARYITLDTPAALSAATSDPGGFIAGMRGDVVIDEVQRAPQLFPVIKESVDRDRRPGRFLLSGSANALALPRVADHLVGRVEVVTLWPFSQGEIEGAREGFIDALFAEDAPHWPTGTMDRAELLARIVAGGYPEAVSRTSVERREAWFDSYITTVLQRDVRDFSGVEALSSLPRLLSLLASRAAGLLNYADISRSLGTPQTTLRRHFELLRAAFLVRTLDAWSSNLGLRLVKAPKLCFVDSGVLAHSIGFRAERADSSPGLGPLVENFVAMELARQAEWSAARPKLFHFRSHDTGREVDIVLEDRAGRLVGIEVKASATVVTEDFRGLRALAEAVGDRFVRGVVLHLGRESVPFGADLFACPLEAVWRTRGPDAA
ncbi:MAG: ATP-binding protein [Phycisphaeraceae bacterium]|nr:MAG: ATP-binding protein [Phycisphaeraceae bacterium]